MSGFVVDHNPLPGQAPGIAGFKGWIRRARSSFPDLEAPIETVVGEWVAAQVTWRIPIAASTSGSRPRTGRMLVEAYHVVGSPAAGRGMVGDRRPPRPGRELVATLRPASS